MSVEPRLYLDAPLNAGARLDLEKDQAHYLLTVMRRKTGDYDRWIANYLNGAKG